ncbi:hypothetical protein [Nitrosomonas sp. Is37]|uniref:hypothetical protein n=1 Tax=Nitrosomonas sp. Is37 TaxID=3080535 RepID=UPI00294B57D3|nr:hypothetical protein [Nitrosomonas sp. Is37]MDV6344743.1 hypothetical protein [Nitrosomonas sp. Is37]
MISTPNSSIAANYACDGGQFAHRPSPESRRRAESIITYPGATQESAETSSLGCIALI